MVADTTVTFTEEDFEQLVLHRPFQQNRLLEDDDSHRKVLGDLYKPNYKWPIVSRGEVRVDMRLFDRTLIDPTNPLRPGARNLLEKVREGEREFGLLATAGSGKRSD
jgi:hypothetical protein